MNWFANSILSFSVSFGNLSYQFHESFENCLSPNDKEMLLFNEKTELRGKKVFYVAFFVSPVDGVFWMIWFCCCVLCSFSCINSVVEACAGCDWACCCNCSWYFLKFSSTSKCVKRFDMLESPEWSVRERMHPSFLSKSVNCFSSFRSHGRWSSWTW